MQLKFKEFIVEVSKNDDDVYFVFTDCKDDRREFSVSSSEILQIEKDESLDFRVYPEMITFAKKILKLHFPEVLI